MGLNDRLIVLVLSESFTRPKGWYGCISAAEGSRRYPNVPLDEGVTLRSHPAVPNQELSNFKLQVCGKYGTLVDKATKANRWTIRDSLL
jgi:hypothetical protein